MLHQDLIKELNGKHLPLANKIRRENSINSSSDKAYSFIITGLRMLYPSISEQQLKEDITDSDRDGGFDAIVFLNRESAISIFDFKRSRGFAYNEVRSFIENINSYALSPDNSLIGLANKVRDRLTEVRRRINDGWELKLYIVRDVLSQPSSAVLELGETIKEEFSSTIISFDLLDSASLIKNYLKIKTEQNNYNWPIDIILGRNNSRYSPDSIIIKERRNGPIKSMFARLSLVNIVELQKDFIEKNIDLFDVNVRDFQKNKGISEKIGRSIINHPESFYIFHNGLTFTCNSIERRNKQHHVIINPQVINGCQTINTIYDLYKNKIDDENIKTATVLCRFYALSYELIEKVCEATNTQIKISLWDLRSNDSIQKILEKALFEKRIIYKRKKTIKKITEVFITDLAQWIYSCIFKQPAKAKNKKAELFDVLLDKPPYKEIFCEDIKLNTIIKICKIALFVKKKIKRKNKKGFEKNADLHIIAALYKLRTKRGTLDSKYNRTRQIIKDIVIKMRDESKKDLTYNEIFAKSTKTWRLIEQKLR